ncbi:MAG TPA: DUF433 domain-containing protein [Leptospiraceae bacterium]|nr:DUF433 domain-containing protein [Leptospiraceae bacterium]
MDYRLHIEINSEIRFGKPCIKSTRISVYDVLSWFASGMTTDEILEDFPQLTKENILACFAYSADRERRLKIAV